MPKIQIAGREQLVCSRCGEVWPQKGRYKPATCTACKSPNWDERASVLPCLEKGCGQYFTSPFVDGRGAHNALADHLHREHEKSPTDAEREANDVYQKWSAMTTAIDDGLRQVGREFIRRRGALHHDSRPLEPLENLGTALASLDYTPLAREIREKVCARAAMGPDSVHVAVFPGYAGSEKDHSAPGHLEGGFQEFSVMVSPQFDPSRVEEVREATAALLEISRVRQFIDSKYGTKEVREQRYISHVHSAKPIFGAGSKIVGYAIGFHLCGSTLVSPAEMRRYHGDEVPVGERAASPSSGPGRVRK